MEVYTELLDRIRAEIDREMDLATHYGERIVAQDQRLRMASIAEEQARTALEAAGFRPRRNATGSGLREPGAARRDWLRAEQDTGRTAIAELAARASEAGVSVDRSLAQFAASAAGSRGDLSGHEQALALATAARQREAAALAALEQQRGVHGKRCGQLRQTLDAGEQWISLQALTQRVAA